MRDSADDVFMAQALRLAALGRGSTDPNPTVGCVLVRDGEVVGEGRTAPAGGPHAEVVALAVAGKRAAGATAYVSLEPCSHQGRTGPCAKALIEAGIERAVIAIRDPNPRVGGDGIKQLESAGIAVDVGCLEVGAAEINRGYLSRMTRHRPWVRVKIAASLDGRTALANGQSQWITGEDARRDVHRWRARSSAIVTGIGTLLADDPSLTARIDDPPPELKQPARIILDSKLRTPPTAKTIGLPGTVHVFTASVDQQRRHALERAGVELETVAATPRLDLAAVLGRLAELEYNDVWVEAGAGLSGALLVAGLVDELLLYFAPSFLGTDARGMLAMPMLNDLEQQIRLELDDLRRIGADLRITVRPSTVAGR